MLGNQFKAHFFWWKCFFLKKNNFHNFFVDGEEYYTELSNKENELSLIMAVSETKIINYSRNTESTTSKILKIFMEDLINKLDKEEKINIFWF